MELLSFTDYLIMLCQFRSYVIIDGQNSYRCSKRVISYEALSQHPCKAFQLMGVREVNYGGHNVPQLQQVLVLIMVSHGLSILYGFLFHEEEMLQNQWTKVAEGNEFLATY
jgi:hypothetical protein